MTQEEESDICTETLLHGLEKLGKYCLKDKEIYYFLQRDCKIYRCIPFHLQWKWFG